MILFFHILCLLVRYIAANISKSISKNKTISEDEIDVESFLSQSSDFLQTRKGHIKKPLYEDGNLKFFPPVYVQRYETVAIILQDPAFEGKIRKVVDFGCAELGFFMYLKNMEGVNEILEVDIDHEILQRYAFKAAPLTADYLKRGGSKPLDVYILAGSVADYDDHLLGTDIVVAIELIEHLSEEALNKMPYNIFHNIKPTLAIFTTPNADFNSLFPNLTNFRHVDHKFEWTRKQFYHWTQEIIRQYPDYSVKFYGIGAGPEGTENLGCCTQMAVFQRCEDSEAYSSARDENTGFENYKLIKHYRYPLFVDNRTREEKIVHEIQYQMSHMNTSPIYNNYEDNECEIPLQILKEYVTDLCADDEQLRHILEGNGMKMREKNGTWFLLYTESEDRSSCEDAREDSWLNEDITHTFTYNDENWDCNSDHNQRDHPTSPKTPRCYHKSNITVGDNLINSEHGRGALTKSSPDTSKEFTKNLPLGSGINPTCVEGKNLKYSKSKIPRKRNSDQKGNLSVKKTSLCVRKPQRKISKSCSLDSCLENINYRPCESYLNLIPSGSLSFRFANSDKRKSVTNDSGSSLFSGSLDRAVDSGYPFSFSPVDADLTPEQVDELLTESRSTSPSVSEEEIVDVINRRLIHLDEVVENGDLANNNRDGEGNNVEGLPGQRLINEMAARRDPNDNMMFFPEIEEFPPWLLNLGDLARRPVYIHRPR